MNKKQIETFRMIEDFLAKKSFQYLYNINGDTHVWENKNIRIELHDGEDLKFYKENKQIILLSNNFNPTFFLCLGVHVEPINELTINQALNKIEK